MDRYASSLGNDTSTVSNVQCPPVWHGNEFSMYNAARNTRQSELRSYDIFK